ncbi:E3 ubiquitin-protein ligase TM129 [Anopheles nili]|uniref:E3 ubiquitin-protein ligase TM129 n=1 Tax=Anopheles nili TaxID=185578 RepID=UPI00237B72EB|nr:E3 ubiquitin-protein ligase TM129 [Anopheles nili]
MVPHLIYCIVFVMICFFTIFPTTEIESSGLTLNHLCSRYLVIEHGFVQYHIKATSAKLLIHSAMPIGFVLFVWLMAWINPDELMLLTDPTDSAKYAWNIFCSASGASLLCALVTVFYWSQDGWSNHPMAKKLHSLISPALPDWHSVATNINDEYRRVTKISIRCNAISTLVVTDSWIVKTNLYVPNIALKSDTVLIAYNIDTQDVVSDTLESVEFVNIAAQPLETHGESFNFRINAQQFSQLENHLDRPIILRPSVKFTSLMERFVAVFKEQVALNPVIPNSFESRSADDSCLACLQAQPNVTITKQCLDVDGTGAILPLAERCQPCGCRPLWCVACLATWFANQQQQSERDTWLSRKSTCPMCRAKFCILDVCYIESRTPQQNDD